METHDVVVIGAGLAGLRCATRLAEAGRDVVLLEAEPVVGGRQRTGVVDGFRLDRGFQLLNPAYPAVARWVDVDALDMRPFPAGVRVRRETGTVDLLHPLRFPSGVVRALSSGMVSPRTVAGLARWVTPVIVRPRSVLTAPDRSLREGLDRVGLTGALRREVLEPFLAGVLGEDRGETSDAFTRLLVRMFVLGRPGVPADGIEALPAQLAGAAMRAGAKIRVDAPVRAVRSVAGGVDVDVAGGQTVRARSAVVAVGPGVVADLLPVPRPQTRGLQTWWFASEAAPTTSALLSIDGRRRGPVVNTVVMSNAAPSYAPAGSHLIQATCLLPEGGGATEPDVRRHAAEIFGADTRGWQLLRRDDIPDALPSQPPPLQATRPVALGRGLYVAGDHRDTASIQGALVSGQRAAAAVLAGNAASPRTAGFEH